MSGKQILINSTFWLRGVLSVISRSSLGKMRQGIREGKETAILKNSTFYRRKVMRLEERIFARPLAKAKQMAELYSACMPRVKHSG